MVGITFGEYKTLSWQAKRLVDDWTGQDVLKMHGLLGVVLSDESGLRGTLTGYRDAFCERGVPYFGFYVTVGEAPSWEQEWTVPFPIAVLRAVA